MTIYPELTPHEDLCNREGFEFLNDAEIHNKNYNAVIEMGIPFLTADQLPELQGNNAKVAIIGGGPTARTPDEKTGKTLLDNLNDSDTVKVVTGSAHTLTHEGGPLSPADYCVIGFAQDSMENYIEPHKETTYIVAAQSSTKIFEKLQDAGVKVFAVNGDIEGMDQGQNAEQSIGIGSTSATAGINVFAGLLNKKNFEIYGVDCSTSYSYDVPEFEPNEVLVKTPTGKTFAVDKGYYDEQTGDLAKIAKHHPDINMHFHGDSVNAALFNKQIGHNLKLGADNNNDLEPE